MPSNKRASIALLSLVGFAALGLVVSAAGGCQILSGISDLEATGGKDSVSSTGSKATGTTTSTMTTTTSTMSSATGGEVCDPVDATKCIKCGEEPSMLGCGPPYCQMPMQQTSECLIECMQQQPAGNCGPGTGSGMTAMNPPYCQMASSSASGGAVTFIGDTNVMKMHFKCTGAECNGATLRCSSMTSTQFGRVFPCMLECTTAGSCAGTTFDCSQSAGTCEVICQDDACEGLNLLCGQNTCEIDCKNMGGPPTMVSVTPPDPLKCDPPKVTGCAL